MRRWDSSDNLINLRVKVRDRQGKIESVFIRAQSGDGDRVEDTREGDKMPFDGEVIWALAVIQTDPATLQHGQYYIECGFGSGPREIAPFMTGYIYDGHPITLGQYEAFGDGPGLKVGNEAASTLVNNTALTRTISCPTGARWLWYTGEIFQADDVTRTVTVRADDGTTGQNLHVPMNGEGVGATSRRPYPHGSATAGLIGIVMPVPLSAGDRILITFAAGGSSAGGTARSSAVVREWIHP